MARLADALGEPGVAELVAEDGRALNLGHEGGPNQTREEPEAEQGEDDVTRRKRPPSEPRAKPGGRRRLGRGLAPPRDDAHLFGARSITYTFGSR
jgi:hypothetical protein